MQQQSRIYGFRIGEAVITSPLGIQRDGLIEGNVTGMTNSQDFDTIYILDSEGSTHTISELNLIPPYGWRERLDDPECE
jgi:hypothetical protein